MGAVSQVQMFATISQKENSPVFNVQAVGGPLSHSERGDIIIIIIIINIIIINFENWKFVKIHFSSFY